ncbi:MAG TPA: hypothetical protein VFH31_14965, partial [Pyrinomonadaceae bacterium]|nr:hypothetical protein [Pyrinomonadaceae bacterium]
MKLLLPIFLVMCAVTSTAKEWQGIVPAVATRADVVRLLGHCSDRNSPCEFDLKGERVRIVFSGNIQNHFYECAKAISEDTVLLVEVVPPQPFPIKHLRLGRGLKPLGPEVNGFRQYAEERMGLLLLTKKGKVIQFNYIASAADKNRCADYYKDLRRFVEVVTHCPPITVEGPIAVSAGEIITFKANVQDDPKMTLFWNASAGRIVDRGARTISVDTKGLDGQTLRVTVQGRGSCSV